MAEIQLGAIIAKGAGLPGRLRGDRAAEKRWRAAPPDQKDRPLRSRRVPDHQGRHLAGVHVRLGDWAAAGGLEIVEEQVHDGALEALEALGLLFLVGLRRLLQRTRS